MILQTRLACTVLEMRYNIKHKISIRNSKNSPIPINAIHNNCIDGKISIKQFRLRDYFSCIKCKWQVAIIPFQQKVSAQRISSHKLTKKSCCQQPSILNHQQIIKHKSTTWKSTGCKYNTIMVITNGNESTIGMRNLRNGCGKSHTGPHFLLIKGGGWP